MQSKTHKLGRKSIDDLDDCMGSIDMDFGSFILEKLASIIA